MLAARNQPTRLAEQGHAININECIGGLVRNSTKHGFGEVAVLCQGFLLGGNTATAVGFVPLDNRHHGIWLVVHTSGGNPRSLSRGRRWTTREREHERIRQGTRGEDSGAGDPRCDARARGCRKEVHQYVLKKHRKKQTSCDPLCAKSQSPGEGPDSGVIW